MSENEKDYGHATRAGTSEAQDLTEVPVPYGYCHCGCGGKTNISKSNDSINKRVKGEPVRYLPGHSGGRSRKPLTDRYVEEDRGYHTPCWIWTDFVNEYGYGRAKWDGQTHSAHRLIYEREVGDVPEGLQLDHLCQVRNCVNPDHLEPVTNAENSRRSSKAKLNVEQAAEIKTRRGERAADLADEFGVNSDTIYNVWTGRRWADVPPAPTTESQGDA